MNVCRLARMVLILILCFSSHWLYCQNSACEEIRVMGRMASATSLASLNAEKKKTPETYRVQLVYTARMLQIEPHNLNAARMMLDLIPSHDENNPDNPEAKNAIWWDLLDMANCKSGAIYKSDLMPTFRIQERLFHELAKAVLLVPDRMFDYVSFASDATNDISNDYEVQMRTVCLARHNQFVAAVDKLQPDDKQRFVTSLLDPKDCRVIRIGEQ